MSKAEILDPLPTLRPDERQEILDFNLPQTATSRPSCETLYITL
jgi:hypothetical protein